MSHLAEARNRQIVLLERPFSGFDFVEDRFSGDPAIRKLFSMSRCRDGRALLLEDIAAEGNVAEENEDLARLSPGFAHHSLTRVSFWKKPPENGDELDLTAGNCLGYALLKCDFLPTSMDREWHVYEAVFSAYPHPHNFVNASADFTFKADGREITINGCLYAQQNGINKTCAQVAIRSIAATYFGNNDLSYRRINELAAGGDPSFDPANGFTNVQTSAVLTGLGIDHIALDYAKIESDPDPDQCIPTIREDIPYQKALYSGIESGCGALMAFSLSGPSAPDLTGHIIPFFGHTFNEDAWSPNAEPSYFRIGETISYLPSRSWISSFIAHDDNFGANLCVPQNFIKKSAVSCVYELLPPGWAYSGVWAEFAASDYFHSILPNAPDDDNLRWMHRLRVYVKNQRLILRHVPITREAYLNELKSRKDWEGNNESEETIEEIRSKDYPEKLWMVEVSVPEVFPTNKRKLGEILLDATRDISSETDGSSFVLARLPGYFVFFDSLDDQGRPIFTFTPNSLKSHTRLYPAGKAHFA